MNSPPIIVEVEGYVGGGSEIIVVNGHAESKGLGRDDRLYCIASQDEDGVFRFVDWGYPTLDEARQAWPEAIVRRAV
jgi:hypothetical protein